MAAAGQTLVVLTGNLDLSVGSIMGLSAYVIYDLTGDVTALRPSSSCSPSLLARYSVP